MQLLLAAVVATSGLVGTTGSLEWSTDYGAAKQEAREAKRPLLVVIENPEDPQKRYDQEQLASDQKLAQLMRNYQLCRIDATTEYGRQVAQAFHVTQLPYTAILDRSASFVTFRGAGKLGAEQLARTLDAQKNGAALTAPVHQPLPAGQSLVVPGLNGIPAEYPVLPRSNCPSCVRGYR